MTVRPPGFVLMGVELFRCERLDSSVRREVCADRSARADRLRMGEAGLLSNPKSAKAGKSDLSFATCRDCPVGHLHRGLASVSDEGESPGGVVFVRANRDGMKVHDSIKAAVGREKRDRRRTILRHPGVPEDGGASEDSVNGWATRLRVSPETIRIRRARGYPMDVVLSSAHVPAKIDPFVRGLGLLLMVGIPAEMRRPARRNGHRIVMVEDAASDRAADILVKAGLVVTKTAVGLLCRG